MSHEELQRLLLDMTLEALDERELFNQAAALYLARLRHSKKKIGDIALNDALKMGWRAVNESEAATLGIQRAALKEWLSK